MLAVQAIAPSADLIAWSHLGSSYRVIDLAFVRRDEDGTVQGVAITDLDADGSLDIVGSEGVVRRPG